MTSLLLCRAFKTKTNCVGVKSQTRMKFCNWAAFVVFMALVCFQIVPDNPPNAQRERFRALILRNNGRELGSILEMFENKDHHKALSLFCKDVAVSVCSEELTKLGSSRRVLVFCEAVVDECGRYLPENVS